MDSKVGLTFGDVPPQHFGLESSAPRSNLLASSSAACFLPSSNITLPGCNTYIPAIIVPVLWEVELLPRNIWSIDVPVKKIILIVNHIELPVQFEVENHALRQMRNVVAQLQDDVPDPFLQVLFLKENLGFARSMNMGMRLASAWAPWWLCVNADISYTPGALLSVIPLIWKDHVNGTFLYMLGHGFSAIIFTRRFVSEVGLYDEHIWPAYVEDCDLMLRVRMTVGDVNKNHHEGGESGKYLYLQPAPPLMHVGGQGSSSNSRFRFAARIQQAHANNIVYYQKKWGITALQWEKGIGIHGHGCGVPMHNQFSSPFNVSLKDDWESLPFVLEHDKTQKEIFTSI